MQILEEVSEAILLGSRSGSDGTAQMTDARPGADVAQNAAGSAAKENRARARADAAERTGTRRDGA